MFQANRIAGRSLASGLLALSGLLLSGCGDDGGLEKRYAVSGRVTYKGQPVKKGSINFVPNKPEGHAAAGTIVDGSYSLTTLNPSDGAIPGMYKVTVDDREPDQGAMKTEAEAQVKKHGLELNQIPQDIQAKAMRKAKGSLPGKYQIASTSDVEKEVKAQSNTIDIELKD